MVSGVGRGMGVLDGVVIVEVVGTALGVNLRRPVVTYKNLFYKPCLFMWYSASCNHSNGGCEHHCVETPTSVICRCHDRYVLAGDNSTCLRESGNISWFWGLQGCIWAEANAEFTLANCRSNCLISNLFQISNFKFICSNISHDLGSSKSVHEQGQQGWKQH